MNWLKRFWPALNEPATSTVIPMEAMNNFTPRAQQVLALARFEADRFNHNFVGTEHLLLGLIKLGQGTAVKVLRRMGLDLETVRLEIEKQVGTGPDQRMVGHIPYTPRVKRVLALAASEARALNHTYVGTEHILLGFLREGDGVAGRVFKNLGVDIEQTRLEILKELDPHFALDYSKTQPAETKKSIPVTPGTETTQTVSTKSQIELIDLTKPYDVYCAEGEERVVVYRNARFKGVKSLYREGADLFGDFYQLEQADGQAIFVAKYSVIKFCEPGTTPGAETVSEKKP